MVSKLSGTSKNFAGSLMTDPQKMENIISMVRTVAPLTSTQTVTKVNTYLPMFEKMSTLLGMYSFLNRAQTFRPIQPLSTNSPVEAVTALMKNSNVSKMLAQPFLANNMDKIMGTMAMNMVKNGNFNDILSSMAKSAGSSENGSGGLDINGLMETFMPLLNSMSTNSINENEDNHTDYKEPKFKSETVLPYDESQESGELYENLEKVVNYSDNKNSYMEKKEIHRPIRIKQRRRK